MARIWSEMTREELDELILRVLTRLWVTPKQLEVKTGVPWRVLMRALPRLQMYGKVEGRLEQVTAMKHRKRPQRRYRLPASTSIEVFHVWTPAPRIYEEALVMD